jgi:hypothetical protein
MKRRRRLLAILYTLGAVLVALIAAIVVLPDMPASGKAQVVTQPTPTPTLSATATVWTDPAAAAQAAFTPVRLQIARMNLDAGVIPVGVKSNGAMDTPHCVSAADPVCGKVFWWDVGAVPGQNGNVVIAGHINRPDASPASFWYLYKMQKNDLIQVTVANGMTLTYIVTNTTVVTAYAEGATNPVLTSIFGPATTPQLNLITCFGDWDGQTFDHRLIVEARLVGTSPYPNQ